MKLRKALGPLIWIALAGDALAERPKPAEPALACSSFTEARKLVGTKQCIRGRVVRVSPAGEGRTFLDFCEDSRACAFTVVVFDEDRHHVGTVESLVGSTIEIRGKIRDHEGRAEIVLEDAAQLGEAAKRLPPTPKEFDVEEQGKFSPGTFHATKGRKASRKKAKLPSTLDVEEGANE